VTDDGLNLKKTIKEKNENNQQQRVLSEFCLLVSSFSLLLAAYT